MEHDSMSKKSKPILTVAIPTCNRSQSLEKVLSQLHKEKNQDFQIIVSDNDSSDNTEAMIVEHQQSVHNLQYHKNNKNLGCSGNVLKLYELAKTRYIWFLSDDEEVLPGAIDRILEALKKYSPVVALFNHVQVDAYGRKVEEGVKGDIFYDKIGKLANYRPLMRTGFISIIVVEKRLPLNIIKKKYMADNLSFQITLSLLLLNDKFKFYEIASPIVFRNTGYKSGEFFYLMTDLLKAAFVVGYKFDNKKFMSMEKTQIFKAFELYLSQKLGLFKFYGRPTLKSIKRIIQYYGLSSVFILFFPIIYILTPGFLLKFIYRMQLIKIHGEKKGLEIYEENINRVSKSNRTYPHLTEHVK
jgi:glycosyltransferase involved in cell wall biosynthesis